MKKKIQTIFDYFVIYFAIACSGNPFFVYRRNVSNFIFLIALLLIEGIFLHRIQRLVLFKKKDVIFFTTVALLLTTSMTINGDGELVSYVNIFVRLLGAYIFTRIFDYDFFTEKYINIMTFLAGVSIVIFLINQAVPQIVNIFENVPGFTLKVNGLDYRTYVNGIYIYTFLVSYGFGTGNVWAFDRNNGMFWEPGAHQFYLCLAIVFLLESEYIKKRYWSFIVLCIAVFSTGSSTGLLTIIVLLIGYHKKIGQVFKSFNRHYNIGLVLIMPMMLFLFYKYGNYFFSAIYKIENEANNSGYILERIGLSYIYELFTGIHPMFGYGISNVSKLQAAATLNNTYAYYMFALGIPYMLVIIYKYLCSYKKRYSNWMIAFVVLIIGFSSEAFILYIIPLSLMFFDIKNKQIDY